MDVVEAFAALLSHPLDPFQREGCEAIAADRGVLVCAPTGAGKTIVGEFAVYLALSRGTKCFYTTPIKALSNQKYHDLVAQHGEETIGLLTGDVSINADADIVVMTTEVLRNMIYAESPALERLTHVVMDEVHFLADTSRGVVWEEVILSLHESVRIIGLSATVSNSEEFGRWLNTVRGDTHVVVSEHRPVPLDQWMMVGRKIFPLFEPGSPGTVNEGLFRTIDRLEQGSDSGFRSRSTTGGGKDARSGAPRSQDRYRPQGRPEVLEILRSRNMLPAITFIFSRAGCDAALYQCLRSKMVLTEPQEAEEIKALVDAGVEGIPEEDLQVLDFRRWREALARGFAAHHAGMLPAFRHIVEELFVRGLVRAVFATETLALGINMPARTVVLEKLVKFNGEAHVDLTAGQYTQLTGRAGRRGIDTMGNAVVQWAPALDPRTVAGLASTRTYPLDSTFRPGYNMAINLLGLRGFDGSLRLLERSFAQFQANSSVVEDSRAAARLEEELLGAQQHLRAELERVLPLLPQAVSTAATAPGAPDGPGDEPLSAATAEALALLEDYIQLRLKLTAAEREAKQDKARGHRQEVVKVLNRLHVGDVIAIATGSRPLLAVVNAPAKHHDDPRPWVTTEKGWSGRIDASGIANPPVVVGHMGLPSFAAKNPRRAVKYIKESFRTTQFTRPKKMRLVPRDRGNKEVTALRQALRDHPAHAWPAAQRENLARLAHTVARKDSELARAREVVATAKHSLGTTFTRIIDLLEEMDYVEFDGHSGSRVPRVTPEGVRLAHIHSEADLLIAQCLKRGVWNELDPAELAAIAAMCIFENRKSLSGQVQAPTEPLEQAMAATLRIYNELVADEQRHQLPITRLPDAGFSLAIHQWTAGAPLGYCLAAANESGAELTPGDFVRWCRQVVDLLQQINKTGFDNEVRANARRAIDAIQRGVVAIGA
ncbi:DEAD/DEAH box helicase [Corynebacterium lizhenjunii]|uniref:DEAD/DEAH box helicase n=1 Tax=Corynebacterium lizhenjunii TaxID=2709394 RepID=UPI0013EBEE50|nr:RNA helicase [Corynebacterium lizhenjunii]